MNFVFRYKELLHQRSEIGPRERIYKRRKRADEYITADAIETSFSLVQQSIQTEKPLFTHGYEHEQLQDESKFVAQHIGFRKRRSKRRAKG